VAHQRAAFPPPKLGGIKRIRMHSPSPPILASSRLRRTPRIMVDAASITTPAAASRVWKFWAAVQPPLALRLRQLHRNYSKPQSPWQSVAHAAGLLDENVNAYCALYDWLAGKHARWFVAMQGWSFRLIHQAGTNRTNAIYLSRYALQGDHDSTGARVGFCTTPAIFCSTGSTRTR